MPASVAPLPLPAAPRLAEHLAARLRGWQVEWLDATGSTNTALLARLRDGARPPLLLGSHVQTAGRGRAGRPWRTREGEALLFSCGLTPSLPLAALPPLTVVAGLAACEALAALLPPGAARDALAIKWPNDLQWGEAKLAGILAETTPLPGRDRVGLVIGIGINLAGADTLSATLDRPVADWTSLAGPANPADLVAAVAQGWQAAIAEYAAHGFAPFQARFDRRNALAGHDVRLLDGAQERLRGRAEGLDAAGRLLIRSDGVLHPVTVGDVSVRSTGRTGTPARPDAGGTA